MPREKRRYGPKGSCLYSPEKLYTTPPAHYLGAALVPFCECAVTLGGDSQEVGTSRSNTPPLRIINNDRRVLLGPCRLLLRGVLGKTRNVLLRSALSRMIEHFPLRALGAKPRQAPPRQRAPRAQKLQHSKRGG
ncbi:hypothetical protein MRX96_009570 [Rhipicephalus microplus]